MNIRHILHYFRWIIILFNKIWISFIPKDENLILISSWYGKKYSDSSMYEYEYLKDNGKYKAVWYTIDKNIYLHLKSKGYPVVLGNTYKGIWTQIRAKVLLTAIQMSDFNCMYLRNAIMLDLDHGFPIKQVGLNIPDTEKSWIYFQKLLRLGIKYYGTASSYFCYHKILNSYQLKPYQVVFVNKPRIDALFDKELRKNKNKIVEDAKDGRKAFVWMPTHRSCGEVPIITEDIIDLDKLQEVCEKNNVIFIIKKHFYHRKETTDLAKYPNIFDFTSEEIDVQTLLAQADFLVSDYSASYIDYLALDRPIILFAYDLDEYQKKERSLYVPFNENTAGEKISTDKELFNSIERLSNDPYDMEYAEGRKMARLRYFDKNVEMGTSRQRVKEIIDELIAGTYQHDWNTNESGTDK